MDMRAKGFSGRMVKVQTLKMIHNGGEKPHRLLPSNLFGLFEPLWYIREDVQKSKPVTLQRTMQFPRIYAFDF